MKLRLHIDKVLDLSVLIVILTIVERFLAI